MWNYWKRDGKITHNLNPCTLNRAPKPWRLILYHPCLWDSCCKCTQLGHKYISTPSTCTNIWENDSESWFSVSVLDPIKYDPFKNKGIGSKLTGVKLLTISRLNSLKTEYYSLVLIIREYLKKYVREFWPLISSV